MSARTDKITNEALTLPTDLRASLIDKLIESLNIPSQKQIDALWAKEAEIRLKAIKTGKVKTIPGERVFRHIRRKFGK